MSWLLWNFVDIHDLPLLSSLSVSVVDSDVLVFDISAILNLNNLAFLIDEVFLLHMEVLEPSSIGSVDLEIVGVS